jgi:hypothetical protein
VLHTNALSVSGVVTIVTHMAALRGLLLVGVEGLVTLL